MACRLGASSRSCSPMERRSYPAKGPREKCATNWSAKRTRRGNSRSSVALIGRNAYHGAISHERHTVPATWGGYLISSVGSLAARGFVPPFFTLLITDLENGNATRRRRRDQPVDHRHFGDVEHVHGSAR